MKMVLDFVLIKGHAAIITVLEGAMVQRLAIAFPVEMSHTRINVIHLVLSILTW